MFLLASAWRRWAWLVDGWKTLAALSVVDCFVCNVTPFGWLKCRDAPLFGGLWSFGDGVPVAGEAQSDYC